ncbi:hypothetical protein GSI_04631 [Ganoderma sinense ZZ0214-1]|uniref:Uncharacterized protein n=1 Tax=Ganoderma sinense ZZ0214-1 TaxID=1077348 RepID=A0A2G8SHF5_9APHY|nr:hypothetical protein GSI_04631 [Ganoderma sinense ZZ0214-1]
MQANLQNMQQRIRLGRNYMVSVSTSNRAVLSSLNLRLDDRQPNQAARDHSIQTRLTIQERAASPAMTASRL